MSREDWIEHIWANAQKSNQIEVTDTVTLQQLSNAFRHEPLSGRTSDPEAAKYDQASELFLEGVATAREGNLTKGCDQIATAFLLDARSANFVVTLGFPMLEKTNEDEALMKDVENQCVDLLLLANLCQMNTDDMHQISYGGHVLRLLLARKLGHHPSQGPGMLSMAMTTINYLLQRVETGGSIYQTRVLGSNMTLPALLYHRAILFLYLEEHEQANEDLTRALDEDPTLHAARVARANIWANTKLKDGKEVFSEFKRIVDEVHPDHRGLDVAYAWMTYYSLQDPTIGNLEGAKLYYRKCLQSSVRRVELYGEDKIDHPILQLTRDLYKLVTSKFGNIGARDMIDAALTKALNPEGLPATPAESTSTITDRTAVGSCRACGKAAVDSGKPLLRCSGCKTVFYCCKECQRKDWKYVSIAVFNFIGIVNACADHGTLTHCHFPLLAQTPMY